MYMTVVVKTCSANNSDSPVKFGGLCVCSVAHVEVTENSARVTNSLKSVGADQQDVDITYTYSITFIVSDSCCNDGCLPTFKPASVHFLQLTYSN